MPVPMFNAQLDPSSVSLGIRCRVWAMLMPTLIAMPTCRDNIGAVPAAVLLGHQMLSCRLQTGGLA